MCQLFKGGNGPKLKAKQARLVSDRSLSTPALFCLSVINMFLIFFSCVLCHPRPRQIGKQHFLVVKDAVDR